MSLEWSVEERYAAAMGATRLYRIARVSGLRNPEDEYAPYTASLTTLSLTGASLSIVIGQFETLEEALDACEEHAATTPGEVSLPDGDRTYTKDEILARERALNPES